jgi:hypothetical protein
MKKMYFVFCFCCFGIGLAAQSGSEKRWSYDASPFRLEWQWDRDEARMFRPADGQTLWRGGLLPAFWVENRAGERLRLKAEALSLTGTADGRATLAWQIPGWADGTLAMETGDRYIRFSALTVQWQKEIPRIIEMYWGTATVDAVGQSMTADGRPFTPDWDAAGYCVPGAKEGPVQSFFRNWDFGHSHIALGSFGPSLGAPYGAAFPRPALFFAMGANAGWIGFGAGELPDAAMSLKLQSGLAAITYTYREDLWGAAKEERRSWNDPLRITFGQTAYEAFSHYYATFPPKKNPPPANALKASWNTWGNWKDRHYAIPPIVDFARKLGAEVFVVDDPWQAAKGGAAYSREHFPYFESDLNDLRANGMSCGFWETLGWIEDTTACGLTKEDLILDKTGHPCRTSWNFNPLAGGFFFIDLSSEKAREYIRRRTVEEMHFFRPAVIKLDFGYGAPGPQMGVPRNPALRGERYTYELIKLISETAKSVDPDVAILYYGIHPAFQEYIDIVSLDDQGDMWYAVKEGHDQWSLWASLLSARNVALTGSSGYDWTKDEEVILNSFVLGSANAVLATQMPDGRPVPDRYLNRRLALNRWFRRTVRWEPLWLNSHLGDLSEPPQLKCWGRTENGQLTALALRGSKPPGYEALQPFEWDGRWAVVSQDDRSVTEAAVIAVVPFDAGRLSMKIRKPAGIRRVGMNAAEEVKNRTWKNGILEITVTEEQLAETAGFIIEF